MLNNGSFYSLGNKSLREKIDEHYLMARRCESAFIEINCNGQDITYNKDIYPIELLLDRLRQSPPDLTGIDTSWIHDPNSPIYTGYFRQAKFYQSSHATRRRLIKRFIISCHDLIDSIMHELESND